MEGFLKVKTHICCCFLFKFCTCILKKECMKTLFQIGNHQRPQKKASETTEDEKTVKSETAAHKPTSQCGSCLRQLVKPQLKAKPLHAFAHSSLWFISTCIVHSLWKRCWFVTVLDHAAGWEARTSREESRALPPVPPQPLPPPPIPCQQMCRSIWPKESKRIPNPCLC